MQLSTNTLSILFGIILGLGVTNASLPKVRGTDRGPNSGDSGDDTESENELSNAAKASALGHNGHHGHHGHKGHHGSLHHHSHHHSRRGSKDDHHHHHEHHSNGPSCDMNHHHSHDDHPLDLHHHKEHLLEDNNHHNHHNNLPLVAVVGEGRDAVNPEGKRRVLAYLNSVEKWRLAHGHETVNIGPGPGVDAGHGCPLTNPAQRNTPIAGPAGQNPLMQRNTINMLNNVRNAMRYWRQHMRDTEQFRNLSTMRQAMAIRKVIASQNNAGNMEDGHPHKLISRVVILSRRQSSFIPEHSGRHNSMHPGKQIRKIRTIIIVLKKGGDGHPIDHPPMINDNLIQKKQICNKIVTVTTTTTVDAVPTSSIITSLASSAASSAICSSATSVVSSAVSSAVSSCVSSASSVVSSTVSSAVSSASSVVSSALSSAVSSASSAVSTCMNSASSAVSSTSVSSVISSVVSSAVSASPVSSAVSSSVSSSVSSVASSIVSSSASPVSSAVSSSVSSSVSSVASSIVSSVATGTSTSVATTTTSSTTDLSAITNNGCIGSLPLQFMNFNSTNQANKSNGVFALM